MTRPVLILLPVLGLTWLCGVLVHLSAVVAYIFITLNAFQVGIAPFESETGTDSSPTARDAESLLPSFNFRPQKTNYFKGLKRFVTFAGRERTMS